MAMLGFFLILRNTQILKLEACKGLKCIISVLRKKANIDLFIFYILNEDEFQKIREGFVWPFGFFKEVYLIIRNIEQ